MIYEGAELHNVAELLDDGRPGRLMTRLPDALRLRLNANARSRSLFPAGAEIRFNLGGGRVTVTLQAEGGTGVAEFFRGPFHAAWYEVNDRPLEIVMEPHRDPGLLRRAAEKSSAGFDPDLFRLILPYHPTIRLLDLKVEDGRLSRPRPGQAPARRYLAYGSSITHGQQGVLPTFTWASRAARYLGADLVNLGFGGGAHCEPEMADYIAGRRDWDFATLEMGINVLGSMETAEFERRVDYFVSRIARAHPDKWLFCLSMFTFGGDLDRKNRKKGAFREIVRLAAGRAGGRAVYLDGRCLLRGYAGLMADLVHPAPAGMEEIARNLVRGMRRSLP